MALLLNQVTSSGNDMGLAGANHAHGLVPDPGATSGLGQVLTDQGWVNAGQRPGTATNDNAAAGNVGEYITSSNVSGIALSNGTPVNLTSMVLSPGDWDIAGMAGFTAGAATTIPFFEAVICLTSASFAIPVEAGTATVLQTTSGFGSSSTNQVALPIARGSFAVSTTVYLNVEATISAGSANGQGRLRARRVR